MTQTVTNSLQTWRVKHHLTQQQIATQVGVTRQTIIALEKGNYVPSVLLALRIARFFDTTVERIFTLDGEK